MTTLKDQITRGLTEGILVVKIVTGRLFNRELKSEKVATGIWFIDYNN